VDTQIAAGLLGYGDQLGYAALTEAVLGKQVDKGHARTDWSRRPLSAAQLAYAAEDVEHLPDLLAALRADLAARGRTAWLEDECAALADPSLYETDPAEAWQRVKGFARLEGEALGRLVRVAAWRERLAVERDRPRRWILKDEALLALAEGPDGLDALPPAVRRRHAADLEALLAPPVAPGEIPVVARRERLEPAEERQLRQLSAVIRKAAEQESISAPLIAPRKELERLVRGERGVAVLTGWRREVAGNALLEVLAPAV
jgi:ribonuclease D